MNFDFWISLVQFAGALIFLIVIHEFGHFVVCRLLGVEVEEFGIGFPPRITTLFTAWGTKFTLNWLPFGGFVRPKGENDPNVPGGLAASNPWVRLAVFFAGPFMNLLIGVILYAIIIGKIGVQDPSRVVIYSVEPSSPAAQAGLQPGDYITKVNSTPIKSQEQMQAAVKNSLDKPTVVQYLRGQEVGQVTLVPRSNPPAGQGAMGITMTSPTVPVPWYRTIPEGVKLVYQYGRTLLTLPVQMLKGQTTPDQGRLVGLKGMFQIYQEASKGQGAPPGIPPYIDILAFFASITISLGLINLFPFPALDGGRILFALPEIIIRRRIPAEYENWINLIGFAILILLMLYVNLQDFINPLTIPK